MSTALTAPVPAHRKALPTAVSSVLASWWLAVGFTLVLFAAAWPLMIDLIVSTRTFGEGFRRALVDAQDNLSNTSWTLLGVLSALILGVGLFVAYSIVRRRKSAIKFMKLGVFAGMLLAIVLIGFTFYLGISAKPAPGARVADLSTKGPLGPTPVLAGVLLGITALLPYFFGTLALSLVGSDEVGEYFAEAQAEYGQQAAGIGVIGVTTQEEEPPSAGAPPEELAVDVEAPAEPEAVAAEEPPAMHVPEVDADRGDSVFGEEHVISEVASGLGTGSSGRSSSAVMPSANVDDSSVMLGLTPGLEPGDIGTSNVRLDTYSDLNLVRPAEEEAMPAADVEEELPAAHHMPDAIDDMEDATVVVFDPKTQATPFSGTKLDQPNAAPAVSDADDETFVLDAPLLNPDDPSAGSIHKKAPPKQ